MNYNNLQKEEIKSLIRLEDLVREYVDLVPDGSGRLTACCPFHSETQPSFKVYLDTQRFKCFGCGASGDVIEFLMILKKISFQSALNELAKKVGYQIRNEAQPIINENVSYKVTELPLVAHQYLYARGIDGKMASDYGLKYCPAIKAIAFPLSLSDEDNWLFRSIGIDDPVRYRFSKGSRKLPFNFRRGLRASKESKLIYFTEGPFDALALNKLIKSDVFGDHLKYGRNKAEAISLNGLSPDPIYYGAKLERQPLIRVLLDNDNAGFEAMIKIAFHCVHSRYKTVQFFLGGYFGSKDLSESLTNRFFSTGHYFEDKNYVTAFELVRIYYESGKEGLQQMIKSNIEKTTAIKYEQKSLFSMS